MEQIIGWEGLYEIHLTGTPDGQPGVWRCDSYKYLEQQVKKGYKAVMLNHNGHYEHCEIHRLVATHFIKPDNENRNTVDHMNGNKLDNRVQNLRWLTQAEQEINKPSTRGYDFDKSHNKYRARIYVNGKEIFLGYFNHPYDAYRAYRDARERYYPGIFTCLQEEIDEATG